MKQLKLLMVTFLGLFISIYYWFAVNRILRKAGDLVTNSEATQTSTQSSRLGKLDVNFFTKPPYQLNYGKHDLLGKFTVVAFNTENWIFNGNLLQYATIMSQTLQGLVEIEAMVETVNGLNLLKDNKFLKCLVILNEQASVLKDVIGVVKSKAFNVKCNLNATEYADVFNNKITVSVIDIREFKPRKKWLTLYGKKAFYVERKAKKKPSLINCALYNSTRNITKDLYERLSAWVAINRELGLHKLQVYSFDTESEYAKKLKKVYPGYFEFIGYETNITRLCSAHVSMNRKKCVENYQGFFESMNHAEFALNGCYLNSKYKFKYMSFYGFDRFIFPRNKTLEYEQQFSKLLDKEFVDNDCTQVYQNHLDRKEPKKSNHKITQFILDLEKQHGENITRFHIRNALFFTDRPKKSSASKRFLNIEYFSDCVYTKHLANRPLNTFGKFVAEKAHMKSSEQILNLDLIENVPREDFLVAYQSSNIVEVDVNFGLVNIYSEKDDLIANKSNEWLVDIEYLYFLLGLFY
jgi:hypothetical protein